MEAARTLLQFDDEDVDAGPDRSRAEYPPAVRGEPGLGPGPAAVDAVAERHPRGIRAVAIGDVNVEGFERGVRAIRGEGDAASVGRPGGPAVVGLVVGDVPYLAARELHPEHFRVA